MSAPDTAMHAASTLSPVVLEATFGETEVKKEAKLKVGQSLSLLLTGIPGTGYSWNLTSPSSKILSEAKISELPDSPKGAQRRAIVGGPSKSYFMFEAQQRGEHTITLLYKQVWLDDESALTTLQVNVVVE